MDYTWHYSSPIGEILLASDGEKLTGLWFDGQRCFADTLTEKPVEEKLPIFHETARWLDIYFNEKIPDFTPPLSLRATPFRREVWDILLSIPYGQTMTYGQIAHIIAKRRGLPRMSAQAVGGAVGHNPISIIIPCHRVIGAKGNLTGYAGGMEKKIRLLSLEKVDMAMLIYKPQPTPLPKHQSDLLSPH